MVVMPEYLLGSSKQSPNKPRIISEVKKNCFSKLKLNFTTSLQDFGKPKYSGQLLWNTGNSEWVLRTAEVRQGSLVLINKEASSVVLRQPLRELNLRACNAPRTFYLAEAEGVRMLVFQALTDEEYKKWVRTIAAELIRQTPLQNVRFLDILSIIRNEEFDKGNLKKGKSEEHVSRPSENLWESPNNFHSSLRTSVNVSQVKEENIKGPKIQNKDIFQEENSKKVKVRYQKSVPVAVQKEKKQKTWLRTQSMNNLIISDESGISSGDENQTTATSHNVDDFSFLSVKERKKFFESLNSGTNRKETSFLIRSNSISNFKQGTNFSFEWNKFSRKKRTKSLHDLHKTPVKEICQLFESQESNTERNPQTYDRITQRRLQRRERKLEKLSNQIAEAEETIQIVSEDIKSIETDSIKRKEDLEIFAGLQKRIDEEHSKLARLKNEMSKVLKGNQKNILKIERFERQ